MCESGERWDEGHLGDAALTISYAPPTWSTTVCVITSRPTHSDEQRGACALDDELAPERAVCTLPPESRIQCGFGPVGGAVAAVRRTSLRAEDSKVGAGGRHCAVSPEHRVKTRRHECSEYSGRRPSTAESVSSRAGWEDTTVCVWLLGSRSCSRSRSRPASRGWRR